MMVQPDQNNRDFKYDNYDYDDGTPSPAPRALLAARQLQGGSTTSAMSTTLGETTINSPAPCNCCYQGNWKGTGPKQSEQSADGVCRICRRNDCESKFKCYTKTGAAYDIDWICPESSTMSQKL